MGSGALDADGVGGSAGAGLRILAAGMLRPGFDALAGGSPGFDLPAGGRSGGTGLRIDYANARDLAERIVAGEEVDVFASASPEHPRALWEAGLVGEPLAFATSSLVVAVPAGSEASGYEVLRDRGTRVVIEVAGIPLGDYTRDLLGRLDELRGPGFAEAVYGNVVCEVQTVFEVADALLGGEAEAAVLYATDVAAQGGRLRAIELPAEASVGVTCVACVVGASTRQAEAAGWVGDLVGPDAQAVLGAAGFGRPTAG